MTRLYIAALFLIISVANTTTRMKYGYVFDARPRTVVNNVNIYIYNADQSNNRVLVNIVDMQGRLIERLTNRIERIAGEQVITIDASKWGTGIYLVTATDGENSGVIKLLKASQ